jgi:hypothetical protein
MPRVSTVLFLLAVLSITATHPGSARAQDYRMVPDPSANHHDALEEFLSAQGYWPEDRAMVLEPLEGRLDRDHGTHRVVYVETLDDIPGLRPLPDGVTAFVHRRHNVFYLDIADDRLLLGISVLVEREDGRTRSRSNHFETFDLIDGELDNQAEPAFPDSPLRVFLSAHGTQAPLVGRVLMLGAALMVFLALQVRRKQCLPGDRVVADRRLAAARFSYRLAAVGWIVMLAAVYGFIHFSAHLQFLGVGLAQDTISYSLTDRLIIRPDRARLLGLAVSVGSALMISLLLGLWAGTCCRVRQAPEERP